MVEMMDPLTTTEFVKSRFAALDYTYAIHVTRNKVKSFSALPDQGAINARSVLREMARELASNKSYPSNMRLALVQAATSSLVEGTNKLASAERQADVGMLFLAGKRFREEEQDISVWLDALTLAIRLDRELPDDARVVHPWQLQQVIPDSSQTHKYINQLAILAEITRGDNTLRPFRCDLVKMAYFKTKDIWREADNREIVVGRCRQLLRFTNALSDMKACLGDVDWHWRPIMNVGMAYQRMEMTKDAKKHIDNAIQIVQRIQNPDYRLNRYQSLLMDLLIIQYDRKVITSFADEMKQLSNSLDTPTAKEVREALPGILRKWDEGFFEPYPSLREIRRPR